MPAVLASTMHFQPVLERQTLQTNVNLSAPFTAVRPRRVYKLVNAAAVCTQLVTADPETNAHQDKEMQPRVSASWREEPQMQQLQRQRVDQSQLPEVAMEWKGLKAWRARGVDKRRGWGDTGPCTSVAAPRAEQYQQTPLANSLVECAVQVLQTACPYAKAALTHRAWSAYNAGQIPLKPPSIPSITSLFLPLEPCLQADTSNAAQGCPQPPLTQQEQGQTGSSHINNAKSLQSRQVHVQKLPQRPSRPDRPVLVVPKQVPSFERGESPMTSLSAHMLHNLAHIELNAIDLAWDTVARWSGADMPAAFYEDFARVADDESRHLGWCLQRLQELGHEYGDMVAHDLLWQGCEASAGDLTARLAIVPMSQEARGLDAGQRLVSRLTGAGDKRTAAIVARIADEEHAHVAIGVAWFQRVCVALGVEPEPLFRQHLTNLGPDLLKGPFNHGARSRVGLTRSFYDISMWPQEAAAAIPTPAVAAAERGRGKQHTIQRQQPLEQSAAQPLIAACPLPVIKNNTSLHAEGVYETSNRRKHSHSSRMTDAVYTDIKIESESEPLLLSENQIYSLMQLKDRLQALLVREGLMQAM